MASTSTDVDLVLSATLGQFVAGLNEATSKLTGALETMRVSAQKETSEIDQAFETLGLKRFSDIEAEVDEVKAAFERLKASGELTGAALVQAQVRMESQVREIRAQTNGWADALDKVKVQAIAAVGSLAGVVRVLGDAGGAAADFGLKMAEVGTQLDDTSAIPQLSEQVRELAREMGGDAVANAQGLYDILSAGVSDPVDAMNRLTVANKLAVGGVTDVTTAAAGLNAALNSYGAAAGEQRRDAFQQRRQCGHRGTERQLHVLQRRLELPDLEGVGFAQCFERLLALSRLLSQRIQRAGERFSLRVGERQHAGQALDTPEQHRQLFFAAAGLLADVFEEARESLALDCCGVELESEFTRQLAGLAGRFDHGGHGGLHLRHRLRCRHAAVGDGGDGCDQLIETHTRLRSQRRDAADAGGQFGDADVAFARRDEEGVGYAGRINGFNGLPEPLRNVIAGIAGLTAVLAPAALAWASLKGPLTLLAATVLPQLGTALVAASAGTVRLAAGMAGFVAGLSPWTIAITGAAAVTGLLTHGLIEAAEAQQQLDAKVARAEVLQEEIAARQAQAEALKEYANVAVLSAEQVAALGETERASYEQRLQGAKDYESAVTGVLVRQRELEGATDANTKANAENIARQKELNAGLVALAEGLKLAAERAKSGLSPAAQELANQLREASTTAKGADDALEKLFSGISADAGAGEISRIVTAVADVAGGSDVAAVTLRDQLGAALRELSGDQLQAFQAAAVAAMDAGRGSAEGLGTVLDTVVAESLRMLGADAVTIGEKFTAAGEQALSAFNAVADSGRASAQQITAAFSLALQKLSTPEEIESLLASLRQVGPASGVSLGQMEKAAKDAAGAIIKIKSAQGEVDEQVLRSQIRKLEDQYTALHKASDGTAAGLGDLRLRLADLNEQLVASQEASKKTGDSMEDAANRGAEAFDRAASSAGNAASALEDTGDSAKSAERDLDDADKSLRDIDASAQSVTISLGRMSEQWARAAMDAAGSAKSAKQYLDTWNSFNAAYEDQNRQFENRLQQSQKVISALDEEERALDVLRKQYSAIADDELRKLLDAERRAKELREQSTESTVQRTEAERELRREIEQSAQTTGNGGSVSVSRRIEVVLRVQNEQSNGAVELRLTQAQIREISERVIAEIRRDQSL